MAKRHLFFKKVPHKQRTLCVVYIELLIDVVIAAAMIWGNMHAVSDAIGMGKTSIDLWKVKWAHQMQTNKQKYTE